MTDDETIEIRAEEQAPHRPTSQIVVGGALILIGLLWLLERVGWVDVGVTTVLAIATIVVGVSLMILAPRRQHSGLIAFGTILALLGLLTAITPLRAFQGGIGERTHAVATVDELRSEYNLAMGTMTIDLRDLGEASTPSRFRASVGIGELVIRLPSGLPVQVEGRAGVGEVQIMDRSRGGIGVSHDFTSPDFQPDSKGLVIEVEVFMGRVEVRDR